MIKFRILFALFLLCSTIANGETIFKWVDEQGVTHYSAATPTNKKAQQLKTQTAPPAVESGNHQSSMREWEGNENLKNLKKRREEREQAENKLKEERAKRCTDAKKRLGILRQQVPLYKINDEGEREYWDDSAREAETRRMKEEVESNC